MQKASLAVRNVEEKEEEVCNREYKDILA